MEQLADQILALALEQAAELADLDAPRGEAWASDLIALARESLGPTGPESVVERLVAAGGDEAATALVALRAVSPSLVPALDIGAVGSAAPWAAAAGTSRCERAVEIRSRRGGSIAFRFVDSAGAGHVLVVDLVPGPPEQVGEIHGAAPELLDLLGAEQTDLEHRSVDVEVAATRVAHALQQTERPRRSAVINGHLLVARLSRLTTHPVVAPDPVEVAVPDPPARDPEDARYALDLFDRAVGEVPSIEAEEVAAAAARLRAAAEVDDPLAAWLAASDGPVDLDEGDREVVIAALAATIAPRTLEPLDPDAIEASLLLEWADWLGVLVELCREGEGASVEPDALVDRINRCPEVTTSIPARDRPRLSWALAVLTEPWEAIGVVDGSGRLTGVGPALLAAALRMAWGDGAD